MGSHKRVSYLYPYYDPEVFFHRNNACGQDSTFDCFIT